METQPMMEAYTNSRDDVLEMFLDGTEDEVYGSGRLYTRESGEGSVELIAYGWNKLAEYNESTGDVRIFFGHRGNISETVDGYLDDLSDMAEERDHRSVQELLTAAPNVGRPPAEAAQFIDNYKSFSGSDSNVESWASEVVERSVSSALRRLV
jgi:hypothetical protein